ncbi:MAG: FtsX-like permease family protein [Elusimicrobiota bacterium]
MKTIFNLALKNVLGAGLRTWLSVAVLSFTYVLIIFHQGMFTGMLKQSAYYTQQDDVAGGQYWINTYDPYDAVTWDDSFGKLPEELDKLTKSGDAAAVLFRPAMIYPQGRMQPVLIRGIDPNQTVLRIPTKKLEASGDAIPVMVGSRMAEKNKFKPGDTVTIRFRDKNGTFDAVDAKIAEVMVTNVPAIDNGTIWMSIGRLSKLMGTNNNASMVILRQKVLSPPAPAGWTFHSLDMLMKEINDIVAAKKKTSSFLYVILLALSLIGIFDTQILSIFRRKKEIGTLMALGFKRSTVIGLFTMEGAMHGVLAIVVGFIYGTPLMWYTAKHGFDMPMDSSQYGFAIAMKLLPVYPAALILGTVLIIMMTVTTVSYIPPRKISKLDPTEALRGKVS